MPNVKTQKEIFQILFEQQNELKKYGIKKIALFGSFVRDEQTKNSDIDFLIQFSKGKKKYDNFINLAYYLEDLFGRQVDLLTEESLSPYMKPHIVKEIKYVPIG